MKKINVLTFSICWILTFFYGQSANRIKFATLAPKSSSWGKCLFSISKEVYNKSQKQIVIKVYYGGQMGDERLMVNKISEGQLQGAAFTGNGLGIVCKESRILEIPFLFKNTKEVDFVYSKIEKDLNSYFHKKGFHLVGLSETGYAYYFSKKNIPDFDSVRSTKMWMWKGDRLAGELMKVLKVPAIPKNFTDVISSMQTGLINGFYCTPTAAISLQWDKEINYMLNTAIVNVTGGLVLSQKTWSALSPANQKLITVTSKKYVKILMARNRASDKKTITLMAGNGVKILPDKMSGSAKKEIAQKVTSNLEGKMFPSVLIKKVNSLLKDIRK